MMSLIVKDENGKEVEYVDTMLNTEIQAIHDIAQGALASKCTYFPANCNIDREAIVDNILKMIVAGTHSMLNQNIYLDGKVEEKKSNP